MRWLRAFRLLGTTTVAVCVFSGFAPLAVLRFGTAVQGGMSAPGAAVKAGILMALELVTVLIGAASTWFAVEAGLSKGTLAWARQTLVHVQNVPSRATGAWSKTANSVCHDLQAALKRLLSGVPMPSLVVTSFDDWVELAEKRLAEVRRGDVYIGELKDRLHMMARVDPGNGQPVIVSWNGHDPSMASDEIATPSKARYSPNGRWEI